MPATDEGARRAIAARAGDWTLLLQDLIRIPSCFEAEHAIVARVCEHVAATGLTPVLVPIDAAALRRNPDAVEPISEGSWVMVVKTLVLACFTNSSALITVVGVGASKPLLMMREEDTVIDSTPGSDCCARAGAAINMARTAVLLDSASRCFAQPALIAKCMIIPPECTASLIF